MFSGPSINPAVAFRIFPIAQQYGIKALLDLCQKVISDTNLELWPSEPIASSDVPRHAGWVQWLALADEKQSDTLVESCLSQLSAPGDSNAIPILREALASPHLRPLMDGLRPETMIKAMTQLVGLPPGFRVRRWEAKVALIGLTTSLDMAYRPHVIGRTTPLPSSLFPRQYLLGRLTFR